MNNNNGILMTNSKKFQIVWKMYSIKTLFQPVAYFIYKVIIIKVVVIKGKKLNNNKKKKKKKKKLYRLNRYNNIETLFTLYN